VGAQGKWQPLSAQIESDHFSAQLTAPAGGWHRLEVRAVQDNKEVAKAARGTVGIGEVFVVAGQSNSANHGEEEANDSDKTGRGFRQEYVGR